MKTLCSLITILILCFTQVSSQENCSFSQERMLMIGDSWYALMYAYGSYSIAFDKYGFQDISQAVGGPVINGATLELMIQPVSLAILEEAITSQPQIDIVGVSLSGNDFLAGWSENMLNFQENAFFNGMRNDLNVLVNNIKSYRPDIQIFFSGYDYLNFVETRLYVGSPYISTWENMGEPSVLELNTAMARMEQLKINISLSDPQVHYDHSMGLMQYIYGYPIGLPVPPYFPFDPGLVPYPGQLSDNYIPFPGGLPNYPTPLVALGLDGLDAIHFDQEAYQHLADHQTKYFFYDFFRGNPEMTFTAMTEDQSGWVSNSGGLGNAEIKIGSLESGELHKGILSFNTSDIPDNAIIESASLILTRKNNTGVNQFVSDLGIHQIEIINGTFGMPVLEPEDFDAPSGYMSQGCFYGSVENIDYKLRIDIQSQGLTEINKTGNTQFRISFENPSPQIDALMGFYLSGINTTILDVHYALPTPVFENYMLDPDLVSIYPNPSSGFISIKWSESELDIKAIKIYNITGKLMMQKPINSIFGTMLDLREFSSGTYNIVFITEHGNLIKKWNKIGD